MADKLLRQCRLTWPQVFASHIVPPDGVAAKIDFVASHIEELDPWQRGFVEFIRRRRSLSPKQAAKLDEIVGTIRASQMETAAMNKPNGKALSRRDKIITADKELRYKVSPADELRRLWICRKVSRS